MHIDLHAEEPVEIHVDESLSADDLALDELEEIEVRDLSVRGRGLRTGPGEVSLSGTVDARLGLRCVRCLEPFEHSMSSAFELILVADEPADEADEEQAVDDREALLFVAAEGRVELRDVVREQLYLNLPQKPLCRPDCRGLCPTCGADRNRLECGCRSEEVDDRLAPLLELKNKLRGS